MDEIINNPMLTAFKPMLQSLAKEHNIHGILVKIKPESGEMDFELFNEPVAAITEKDFEKLINRS